LTTAARLKKLFIAVTAGALIALPGMALADPPGNNGTVKIDGVDFDTHPNNEPHVGCIFQLDFYGYDEGDLEATYTFELVPPTQDGSTGGSVDIGEDSNSGGGTDLDAEVTVDLSSLINSSGVSPHPVQGYHVKLTVHAEGSQGADVKHKVFWVEGCGPQGSADLPPLGETQTLDGDTTSYIAPEQEPFDGSVVLGLLAAAACVFFTTHKLATKVMGGKSQS
jgi:hypothetical protein